MLAQEYLEGQSCRKGLENIKNSQIITFISESVLVDAKHQSMLSS